MQWQIVVALAVVVPIIVFPAALVWYINIGGALRAIRAIRAARPEKATVKAKVQ